MVSQLGPASFVDNSTARPRRYDLVVFNHPLILGHRGASASARENTLGAYALAVSQDADGIELDVRTTKDGALVLHHDPTIRGVGPIVDKTFEELRTEAAHVPTLDEMLAVTGDLILNIEIKNQPGEPDHDPEDEVARQVVDWIDTNHLHARTIVTSFNWSTTSRVRHLDDRVVTGQLLDRGMPVEDMLVEIATVGHSWVAPHYSSLDGAAEGLISAAHARDLRVVVWTLDDLDRIADLADASIDAIITNDPAGAVCHLARLG